MKKFMPLFLGILLMTPFARSESAEEMVSNCKAVADAKISGDRIAFPLDFSSGVCWGAFGTFQEAIRIGPSKAGKPYFSICAPPESTRSQLIQVFLVYARRHPEQYHESFFDVAFQASQEAFPCSK